MQKAHGKMKQGDRLIPHIIFTDDVLRAISRTVGRLPAESGGPFGGYENSRVVTHFHFDQSGRTSGVTYSPDAKRLNRLFKSQWNAQGIRLFGFIHSHPGRMNCPSGGDLAYAERILGAIEDLNALMLPILNEKPEGGGFRITPWVVRQGEKGKGVELLKGKILLLPKIESPLALPGAERTISALLDIFGYPLDELTIDLDREAKQSFTVRGGLSLPSLRNTEPRLPVPGASRPGRTFDRVTGAYDLERMRRSRLVIFGMGGAAAYAEDAARAGIGQFVLIDADTVSETNLATQQTYRCDIGRPKVDCIAERIQDINPAAKVVTLQKMLNDELRDDEIKKLVREPLAGASADRTLLCGFTDDFFAQARINRLALQFGLPSLCAQVYQEGRAAEVTFTYPGVTPACHRCILRSRYEYFLRPGSKNRVTSHGTPIFATTRLNALKGFITLAMLHHGSNHPRWDGMLSRIGKRNLIQIRLDPDLATTIGIGVFDRVLEKGDQERLFFDEAVWLPQDPESPATGHPFCPDCGGTGDLRAAQGSFADTRLTSDPTRETQPHTSAANDSPAAASGTYDRQGRMT